MFWKNFNLFFPSDNLKLLEVGVELAKVHFKRVFQQIQNFIDMNQIVASGPFLQVFLEEVKIFLILFPAVLIT